MCVCWRRCQTHKRTWKFLCDRCSFPRRVTLRSVPMNGRICLMTRKQSAGTDPFFFLKGKDEEEEEEEKSRANSSRPSPGVWPEERSHAEISRGEPPSRGKQQKKKTWVTAECFGVYTEELPRKIIIWALGLNSLDVAITSLNSADKSSAGGGPTSLTSRGAAVLLLDLNTAVLQAAPAIETAPPSDLQWEWVTLFYGVTSLDARRAWSRKMARIASKQSF